jgi:hypothetical protein
MFIIYPLELNPVKMLYELLGSINAGRFSCNCFLWSEKKDFAQWRWFVLRQHEKYFSP